MEIENVRVWNYKIDIKEESLQRSASLRNNRLPRLQ
jgi:hypothetical protein